MKKNLLTLVFLTVLLFSSGIRAQQLAFPGAEGFGKYAIGGRGGTVYHVTNLNDSGTGSFRDAVSQPNRIVVFDVGGIINISSRVVVSSNITIAGQTAPGDGIVIYGNGVSFSGANNVICRYLRVRMGVNGDSGKDAMGIANGNDMIFDHVSVSWGRDETFSISWDNKGVEPTNITIQNSIIGQGIYTHSCGGLIQTNGGVSLYRNLYIDNKTRNPKVKGVNEFVNNVVYNWGNGGAYIMGDSEALSEANIFNNYFINGPSYNSATNPFIRGNTCFNVYAAGNYHDSNSDGDLDGSLLVKSDYGTVTWMESPFDYPIDPESDAVISAEDTYQYVLKNVGATLPRRDEVDLYMIDELSSLGTKGIVITAFTNENLLPFDVPGRVFNDTPKADSDGDCMPDYWETSQILNPADASDAMIIKSNGYCNLEIYINSITSGGDFLRNLYNFSATDVLQNSLTLNWEDYNDSRTGFVIEQSSDNINFVEIGRVAANVYTLNVTGLEPNKTYYYRGKTINGESESLYSDSFSVKTKPEATFPLESVSPSPGADQRYVLFENIVLSWTNNTNTEAGALSYKLLFGTSADNMQVLATELSTTSYQLTNKLDDYTTYYWRVDATNQLGSTEGVVWKFTTKKSYPEGLVGHWKLDETSGDIAADASGYENEGLLEDFTTPVWSKGVIGNSLDFTSSATTGRVEVSHSDALYFDVNSFSISMWMKSTSTSTCYLIQKGSFASNTTLGTTGKWYGIELKSSKITFAVDDNVTKSTVSGSSSGFLVGTWVHVVAIRDVSTGKLNIYKDGELFISADDKTANSIGQIESLVIGNNNDKNNLFPGAIDDVRIYNYALSAEEILELYDKGSESVLPLADMTWSGTLNNEWSINTDNKNFIANNASCSFFSGANVLFNDNGTAADVNLVGDIPAGTVMVDATKDYVFNGTGKLTGEGALYKTNTGKLKINTLNDFSGSVTIKKGILEINNFTSGGESSSLGASANTAENLILNGGTILYTGETAVSDRSISLASSSVINVENENSSLGINGLIIGGGALTKSGKGTLALGGSNSFSGGANIQEGKIYISTADALTKGVGSGTITFGNGTTLEFMSDDNTSVTYANNIVVPENVSAKIVAHRRGEYTGKLTGSGELNFVVPYIRTYLNCDWTEFTGSFKATGACNDDQSLLIMKTGNDIFASSSLSLDGRITFLHNAGDKSRTFSIGELSGSSESKLGASGSETSHTGKTQTWKIGGLNTNAIFEGSVTNDVVKSATGQKTAIIKIGSGVWTLTGASTYSGGTTVTGGTLKVNNTSGSATGTGSVTVNSGATLAGIGIIEGVVTISSGAVLEPGDNGIGTLSFGNNLTMSEGCKTVINIGEGNKSDLIKVTGALTINGTLEIKTAENTSLVAGNEFVILTGASLSGGFSSISPEKPGVGLIWDQSKLLTEGKLIVAAALLPVIEKNPENVTMCEDETATITLLVTATNAVTYQWYKNNEIIESANALTLSLPATSVSSGEYMVVVKNDDLSVNSTTATVTVNSLPDVIVETSQQPLLTVSGDWDSYQWYKNDETIENANLNSYSVLVSGSYLVEVEKYGCKKKSDAQSITITGIDQEIYTYVNVFPNPSDRCFTVTFEETKTAGTLDIYNVNGDKVYQMSIPVGNNNETLELKNSGVYLLVVNVNNKISTFKLVKK